MTTSSHITACKKGNVSTTLCSRAFPSQGHFFTDEGVEGIPSWVFYGPDGEVMGV
jgi:hypothetical protein